MGTTAEVRLKRSELQDRKRAPNTTTTNSNSTRAQGTENNGNRVNAAVSLTHCNEGNTTKGAEGVKRRFCEIKRAKEKGREEMGVLYTQKAVMEERIYI